MNHGDETQLLCSTVVRALMQDYDWQLLDEDAFIQSVLARMPSEEANGPEQVRKWCINTYCHQALYPACLGTLGSGKRNRGFKELADYLYRLAQRTWPLAAEDATQEALIKVYGRVEQCRNPGAFLAFAIQQLRDAARKIIKMETRALSLDELLEQDIYSDMPADAAVGVAA